MRLVIKVGTQIIAGDGGLSLKKISDLMQEIASVMDRGHEVVLVSSGAIGAGLPLVPHFKEEKKDSLKKMAAAIGQPLLMHDYIREAKKQGVTVSQVLILSDDFTNREHFKNFVFNIENMLRHKILPIINENDVMKREDLDVGDNDSLSAMVARGIKADKLLILTNQDGLYNMHPESPDAELIKIVKTINKKIENYCSGDKSSLGRGGMITKVKAAKYATKYGVETYIGNGSTKDIILNTVENKGVKFPGTKFTTN